MSNTSEIDAGGNNGVRVDDMEGIPPVGRELYCKWCAGLLAVAYMNQKAVSSYILLQVKPKLPVVKIGSHRFLDAMGVWTMASARVLRWTSVTVQVFQIYAGVCMSHRLQGSHRVSGCGREVSG